MTRPTLLPALVAMLAVSPTWAVDLATAYQDALRNDPSLKEAAATRLATLESRPQAFAALLPQVEATSTVGRFWNRGDSTFTQRLEDGTVRTGTTGFRQDTDVTQWQLQITQTLFRWDQFVALRQADKQVAEAEANYRASELDLMDRTAQRYFDVLGARAELVAGIAARDATGRQLEQAEKRFEVGLIAITDVQETQARYDAAVAAVIEGKRSLATAKEFLREITGEYYGDLMDAGPDIPLISPEPNDVEEWVQVSLRQNLNLRAARLRSEVAREEVRARRGNFYPTVDLVAARSKDDRDSDRRNNSLPLPTPEDPDPDPIRGETFPADSLNWSDSIQLQFRVPIYTGGTTNSRVREATYQHQASREELERVARETERQVRDSFLSVNSEISRVNALARSVESNETALRATEAGFEVGTRTTVDVLDARRNLFEAQRDYAQSRYTYVTNAVSLKEGAGTLDEGDLMEINGWLSEPVEPVSP